MTKMRSIILATALGSPLLLDVVLGQSRARAGFAESFDRAGGYDNSTPLLFQLMKPPAKPSIQTCVTHKRKNGDVVQTCTND
jgi:hypothetical protein